MSSNNNYVSARIKKNTYKNIKQLALDLNIPLTKTIDFLYDYYKKNKINNN